MNLEVEPAQAAITVRACANCGAGISQNYCPACGQSAHIHSSLLHLGEEILHGLLHLDAKGWRTLPMLVLHPGQLTRLYVDGQRTRYVSPLILFLFMMFLMFFVVSATTDSSGAISTKESRARDRVVTQQVVDEKTAELASAEAALGQATGVDARARLAAARAAKLARRQRWRASTPTPCKNFRPTVRPRQPDNSTSTRPSRRVRWCSIFPSWAGSGMPGTMSS
ncbi:MAG: DUF3667 domain-containing protein [Pseudomonadota bacterium]